eukprot:gene11614-biopygen3839
MHLRTSHIPHSNPPPHIPHSTAAPNARGGAAPPRRAGSWRGARGGAGAGRRGYPLRPAPKGSLHGIRANFAPAEVAPQRAAGRGRGRRHPAGVGAHSHWGTPLSTAAFDAKREVAMRIQIRASGRLRRTKTRVVVANDLKPVQNRTLIRWVRWVGLVGMVGMVGMVGLFGTFPGGFGYISQAADTPPSQTVPPRAPPATRGGDAAGARFRCPPRLPKLVPKQLPKRRGSAVRVGVAVCGGRGASRGACSRSCRRRSARALCAAPQRGPAGRSDRDASIGSGCEHRIRMRASDQDNYDGRNQFPFPFTGTNESFPG